MNRIISSARVATERAPRYGKQLVSHLGRRAAGVWDPDTGTGTLDMNEHTVHVGFTSTPQALLIELHADESDVDAFEDVVGRHLVGFGARDELEVRWSRADGSPGTRQG